MIDANRKLKFLTTKATQKTQVYICSFIRMLCNVLACSFLHVTAGNSVRPFVRHMGGSVKNDAN